MSKAADQIIKAISNGERPKLPAHPAAAAFPSLGKKDLRELVKDIKEHGLREEIILHPDGSILDGRHRYKACLLAGVEPRVKKWKGPIGSEVAYVISRNIKRRHMDESQRAMTAARLANLQPGKPGKAANLPNTRQAEAAAALNVSVRSTRTAKEVIRDAPENIVKLIDEGRLKVNVGSTIARTSTEEKDRIAAMSDDEAVTEAKRIARKAAADRRREKAPAAAETIQDSAAVQQPTLIEALRAFLTRWGTSAEEERAELHTWLQSGANCDALETLRILTTTLSTLSD